MTCLINKMRYVLSKDLAPILLAVCVAGHVFLPACKPTYPHDLVEKSIVEICRKEFNITVKTSLQGLTLCTFVELNSLIPEISSIDDELVTNLSNIMSSVSRVVLSTDFPFQFIVIHAVDSKTNGTYITMIRYVDDIRRLLTGDISHNEYFNRMVIKSGTNMQAAAEYVVFNNADSIFPSNVNRSYKIEDMRSIKGNEETYYIYALVKEISDRVSPNSNLQTITHQEYLFTIKTKPALSIEDEIRLTNPVPRHMIKYLPIMNWDRITPLSEIILPHFLAEQIAKRIETALTNDPRWSKEYVTYSVSSEFVPIHDTDKPENKKACQTKLPEFISRNKLCIYFETIFNRMITFGKRLINSSDPKTIQQIYGRFIINIDAQERILFLIQKQIQPHIGVKKLDLLSDINDKIITKVLHRYGYYNYKEIQLINTNSGKTLITP
ncbi:MAG: hypothetical protein ABII23_08655 [bacterium]